MGGGGEMSIFCCRVRISLLEGYLLGKLKNKDKKKLRLVYCKWKWTAESVISHTKIENAKIAKVLLEIVKSTKFARRIGNSIDRKLKDME